MKQAFLKRFNPWGDTRRQQQDAWNKFKFDMTKDDVDAFVVDMKMLASILGHNKDVIMEKFKDIFPDPNIEAALIAMDDFVAMQAKAKQLIQIYKPTHDSTMASAAILVHTAQNASTKSKSSQPKSNQHQLTPINLPQDPQSTGEYTGGQRGRGCGQDRGSHGHGEGGNSDNRFDHQDQGDGRSEFKRDFQYNRGRGQDSSFRGRQRQWDGNDSTSRDRDNRDRNSDGQGNSNRGRRWDGNRGQGHSDRGRGRKWNPSQQYHDPGYQQQPQYSLMNNIHILSNSNISHKDHQHHHARLQTYVNCVKIKAIMIINANLQAISWLAHKKLSIKVTHITTKTRIKESGQMGTMTIMTLMGNLFSNGGSRCH